MKNIFEKVIQDLEKINWKDFNKVAISNKRILENIYNNRGIIDLLLKNVLKNDNLISLAEHYDFFDKIVLYIDKQDRFRIRLHIFSGEDT